ncbi:dehydrin ERD14-like [Chenopodium quinoa]|uniref:Dehydrin 1 n=1 Tax=Chenopodium quinoa TaxID=63459 RepID=A0A0G2QNF4_CHEQI|nr:dehydrin ERD14-like [Chenopodium quinoa]AGM15308.1 dehydrin 1 [Chenopodium quinoa]
MADERNYEAPVETTDRGMFDFMKKKDGDGHKPSEADTVTSSMENVHVSEPVEEKKHGGLVEKFHRSHSSSSSSSDEEGDDEEKKRKKKEKKEKKQSLKENMQEKLGGHKDEHDHETNVPIEKIHVQDHVHSEPSYPAPEHHHQEEEKKGGFLDKIKDKLPGQHKDKAEEHEVVAPAEPSVEGDKDKKGFLDKIKDKIPGFHSKNGAEEKKDHEEKKEGY